MNRPRTKNTDLPQCVYWKNGAYWYVKRGKWTRLGKTRKEMALKWATILDGAPGSVTDLIARALPIICKDVKPNTANQYRIAAKKLAKMLAEFRVEEVEPKTVAGIKRQLSDTPNMANRCLSVLRLIFNVALEDQEISVNPAVGIARHIEKKRDRLLTMVEYKAIYKAAGPRLQVIMDLAIRTGQRIGDVLKIKRTDLLDEGILFEQQKTGAKVVIRWTPEIEAIVERAKKINQNIRAFTLLHNRRGKAPDYSTVKIQWDKARTAAKVPDARLHDLRAFAATTASRQGISPKSLLGHRTDSQTVRYLRDRDAVVVDGPSFGSSKSGVR